MRKSVFRQHHDGGAGRVGGHVLGNSGQKVKGGDSHGGFLDHGTVPCVITRNYRHESELAL